MSPCHLVISRLAHHAFLGRGDIQCEFSRQYGTPQALLNANLLGNHCLPCANVRIPVSSFFRPLIRYTPSFFAVRIWNCQ